MRCIGTTVLLISLIAPATTTLGAAPPEDALRTTVDQLAAAISEDPSHLESLLSADVLAAVPWPRMEGICKQYYNQCGKVVGVRELERTSGFQGKFMFEGEKGFEFPVTLTVGGKPTQIIGIWFGMATAANESTASLLGSFRALSGSVSLYARELGSKKKPILDLHSERSLAIGSTFKLYILGALVAQAKINKRKWNEVVPLRNEWKSLPSGVLQEWPGGAPLTLHTLATLMISMSDNTATDHLLTHLGRDQVEAAVRKMGHASPLRLQPFLTTSEMFRLKWGGDETRAKNFIEGNMVEKRRILRNLPSGLEGVVIGSKPDRIDTIEWFATTRDLCQAMAWLRNQTETPATRPARELLAINPGLSIDRARWTYAGYKGGSEPGVLNLTFLLGRNDGRWFALSATWNDPESSLVTSAFFGLVTRAIKIVGQTP